MQQLTMTKDRAVEWWDVPAPVLQDDGQAIVRPLAVALCDMDQPTLRGETPVTGPVALGHEFAAEVVDVGDAVTAVSPGRSDGTYTDQIWTPSPPSRSRLIRFAVSPISVLARYCVTSPGRAPGSTVFAIPLTIPDTTLSNKPIAAPRTDLHTSRGLRAVAFSATANPKALSFVSVT